MKAVIWTDVFQTVMMFGSMLLVMVKGIGDAGGLGRVWTLASKTDRLEIVKYETILRNIGFILTIFTVSQFRYKSTCSTHNMDSPDWFVYQLDCRLWY